VIGMTREAMAKLAALELVQLEQEGRDTTAPRRKAEGPFAEFWEAAAAAPMLPESDYPFVEPTEWDEIVAVCPRLKDGPEVLPHDAALEERIHGAWLGRCAGCMLGKPVEGWTRAEIAALLNSAGEYPLDDYFPVITAPDGAYKRGCEACLRGNIVRSERDDDTDYTLLGLHLMKTYGRQLRTADVGAEWLLRLPYHKTYTAERAAYRNLVMDVPVRETAVTWNPYREWIGAQIRADAFGYVCPGWEAEAARLAWQDAALSHVKNGIYGEMFFAALIAASLVSCYEQLGQVIERAMATIPPQSRFAEMVSTVTEWCADDETWEQTWERISAHYGRYHRVHTINNAALVLMGLLHSDGDLGDAISIAVMGGWDTDCNGATTGSVMGALVGAKAIADKWRRPLNDTLHSALDGYNVNAISELAAETVEVGRNTSHPAPIPPVGGISGK